MADQLVVQLSGDASRLLSELRRAGISVKQFGDSAGGAGQGAASFRSELSSLAGELGLAVGLAAVTQGVASFATEAYKAGAAAERLSRATDAMAGRFGENSDSMVSAIQTASNMTISRMDAMKAANTAMMFGIVKDKDDMTELTQIAVTLGAAMGQDATKSLDDLSLALGRQSRLILDNLGIIMDETKAQESYAATLGKSVEALTDEEKAQAFAQAALVAGRAKVEELGGVTMDTAAKAEQLGAAWSDFQVAFGQMMNSIGLGEENLTTFIRKLEEGAGAWQGIFERIGDMSAANRAMVEAANAAEGYRYGVVQVAQASQQAASAQGQDAEAARAAGLAAMYAGQQKDKLAIANSKLLSSAARATLAEEQIQMAMAAAASQASVQTQRLTALAGGYKTNAAALHELAVLERERGAVAFDAFRQEEAAAVGRRDLAEMAQAAGGGGDGMERAKAKYAAEQEAARETGQAQSQAMTDAANSIKSTIESVIQPSLDEVWKPDAQTGRIDEWARRMATVATSGLSSEWLGQLQAQFGGFDFFQPIADAMASGDSEALKQAATDLLTNNVTALWDVEAIKERVRQQLQEQNLRDQIIQQVQEELGAEGISASTGFIAVAAGDVGAATEEAGAAADNLANRVAGAGDTMKSSLDKAAPAVDEISLRILTLNKYLQETITLATGAGNAIKGLNPPPAGGAPGGAAPPGAGAGGATGGATPL